MACEVQIQIGRTSYGKWGFEESADAVSRGGGRRTADGFIVGLPTQLQLEWRDADEPRPIVTGLRAILRTSDGIDLGIAEDDSGRSYEGLSGGNYAPMLSWRGSAQAFEHFERARGGRPPTLHLTCYGEGHLLLPMQGNRVWVRGQSSALYGTGMVTYPQDQWGELVRRMGLVAPVLVEVPLPFDRRGDWAPVWKALRDAQDYFLQGGETGWKGTVASVRLALEKWREIEPVEHGSIKAKERDDLTKEDRLAMMRHQLLQLAHYGPHTHADQWRREDAVLLLSCMAGLLATRNP